MYKKHILDNSIVILILFIGISIANILFSVHFIPVMFAGIIFISFIKTLESKSYYSLFLIFLTFLVIENIQGFRAFSLVLIALSIYIFIKPYIQQIFSSYDLLNSLYITIFYLFLLLSYSFFNGFDTSLLLIIIVNILVDTIIVGLFI